MNEVYKVANVLSSRKLVLNVGSESGIKMGFKFLIYSLGDEIFDPDTKEALGQLEIVKGRGIVTHVQDKICIIESEKKIVEEPTKTLTATPYVNSRIATIFGNADGKETTTYKRTEIQKPFDNPSVGDYAKYIS